MNITGTLRSDEAPMVDTSVNEPSDWNAGAFAADQFTFRTPNSIAGMYKNEGNVTQTVTVSTSNLSGNISSVTVDLNGFGDSITLQPEEFVRPTFTVVATRPVAPTTPGAPSNEEPFTFDVNATWEVV